MMEKGTWLIDKNYSDTMKRMQAIVFSEQLIENPFLNLHANLGTMIFNASDAKLLQKLSSNTATN